MRRAFDLIACLSAAAWGYAWEVAVSSMPTKLKRSQQHCETAVTLPLTAVTLPLNALRACTSSTQRSAAAAAHCQVCHDCCPAAAVRRPFLLP
jgi:hypothetical protein